MGAGTSVLVRRAWPDKEKREEEVVVKVAVVQGEGGAAPEAVRDDMPGNLMVIFRLRLLLLLLLPPPPGEGVPGVEGEDPPTTIDSFFVFIGARSDRDGPSIPFRTARKFQVCPNFFVSLGAAPISAFWWFWIAQEWLLRSEVGIPVPLQQTQAHLST